MIASDIKDLWGIYQTREHLDPRDLTRAIEDQVRSGDLDYRTRLLIRESIDALRGYWGMERLLNWIQASPVRLELEDITRQEFDDDVGFPSLRRRVMEVTRPEAILEYFQDLARHIRRPLRLAVGGSIAVILPGMLSRYTEDIDIVDEVPAEIRSQHAILQHLKEVHKLELGHFQRHYLAMGWESRLRSLPPFDQLQVSLLDPHDIFLSKLFSIRTKDRQDLKALKPQLDKDTLVRLIKESAQSMLAAPGLRERAENNWYMLFGESLPQ